MNYIDSYIKNYQKGLIIWTPMDKPTLLILIYICGLIIFSAFAIFYSYIWIIILIYLIGISVLLSLLIREAYDGINYYYGFERKIFNCSPEKIKKEIENLLEDENMNYVKNERKDIFNKKYIRTIYFLKDYNLRIILNNLFGMICINTKENQKMGEIMKKKIDNKLKKFEYNHVSIN